VIKDRRLHVQAAAGIVADSRSAVDGRKRSKGARHPEAAEWLPRRRMIGCSTYDSFTYNLVQYLASWSRGRVLAER